MFITKKIWKVFVSVGFITLLFLLFFNFYNTSNWYNANWCCRGDITVDNYGNPSELTNYQVKIELTPDNFNYSKALSTGSDIRFTDANGLTILNHWIEEWDNFGISTIWVKIPKIPSSADKTIYMYYGNAGVSSTSNGYDTFEL